MDPDLSKVLIGILLLAVGWWLNHLLKPYATRVEDQLSSTNKINDAKQETLVTKLNHILDSVNDIKTEAKERKIEHSESIKKINTMDKETVELKVLYKNLEQRIGIQETRIMKLENEKD